LAPEELAKFPHNIDEILLEAQHILDNQAPLSEDDFETLSRSPYSQKQSSKTSTSFKTTNATTTTNENNQDEQHEQQNEATSFLFPITKIPIKYDVPNNLTMHDFQEIKYIADGSNANIFIALYHGQKVIIKMIKAVVETNPISLREFEFEYQLLTRICHPNIINIYGAGYEPRRFLVLEYLTGGTLQSILKQNLFKPDLASRLFHKQSFPMSQLLSKGRDLADALDYLHRQVHPGACILHRGKIKYSLFSSSYYYYFLNEFLINLINVYFRFKT
jgi:hypothetical protein